MKVSSKIRHTKVFNTIALVICILVLGFLFPTMIYDGGITIGLILLGVICLVYIRATKRLTRIKLYVPLIHPEWKIPIEHIATSTKQSVRVVRADLRYAVRKHFLDGIYYDMGADEIGPPPQFEQREGMSETIDSDMEESAINVHLGKRETEVVICSGCSAKNIKVKGEAGTCEYCGAPI